MILAYLSECDSEAIDNYYLDNASILLSGSTGWGIEEGFDSHADWDIHIILDESSYQRYLLQYGPNHVVDDHLHNPIVFAQIRSKDWLVSRLKAENTSLLYLWIYANGTWIKDGLNISTMIQKFQQNFEQDLQKYARESFVKFSVRRLDASSSAKRGLLLASNIYCGEMIESALRAYCVSQGSPYPYNKWLAKQVEMLGGFPLLNLCENVIQASSVDNFVHQCKRLRNSLENTMREKFDNQRWIDYWWEYNEN